MPNEFIRVFSSIFIRYPYTIEIMTRAVNIDVMDLIEIEIPTSVSIVPVYAGCLINLYGPFFTMDCLDSIMTESEKNLLSAKTAQHLIIIPVSIKIIPIKKKEYGKIKFNLFLNKKLK